MGPVSDMNAGCALGELRPSPGCATIRRCYSETRNKSPRTRMIQQWIADMVPT
jgi:hypothetical protein